MSDSARRSLGHRLTEATHLLGAAVWLSGLVMGGVVAAIIFGTTPELEPSLGLFERYEGDHANLLAGYIQNKVFLAGDVLQFSGAFLCLGSLVLLIARYKHPVRRLLGAIRVVSVLSGITLLSYSLLLLSPRMAQNLETFYHHASAGENTQADEARAAFLEDHPRATRTHSALAALVLVVFLSGTWSATGAPNVDRPLRKSSAGENGKRS